MCRSRLTVSAGTSDSYFGSSQTFQSWQSGVTLAIGPHTKTRITLQRGAAHVTAGALCVGCVGTFSEMIEREYEDMAAAKAAGVVGAAAWLPDILRGDARRF